MGSVAPIAMRRKAFTLLAVAAVVLVAAGGASAANLTQAEELAPKDDSGQGGDADVGVCVVGADSPCNGEDAKEAAGEQTDGNDSDDNEMWIPEDQNRDGEIDDRFTGNDESKELDGENESTDDHQIWIPEDQNRDGEIDDRFTGTAVERFASIVSGVLGLF